MAKMSTGTCVLCNASLSKGKMPRHVLECASSHDNGNGHAATSVLLVEPPSGRKYWLYVECAHSSTLSHLDQFLRDIWVECCDHLSAFRDNRRDISKKRLVADVFDGLNAAIHYEYDFGSTTELKAKLVARRENAAARKGIRLLARNDPLDWKCCKCGAPATVMCPACIYDGDAMFCGEHGKEHPCAEEEMCLPVVNSPRMGVCGYTG